MHCFLFAVRGRVDTGCRKPPLHSCSWLYINQYQYLTSHHLGLWDLLRDADGDTGHSNMCAEVMAVEAALRLSDSRHVTFMVSEVSAGLYV
jgi:hypothetical protein